MDISILVGQEHHEQADLTLITAFQKRSKVKNKDILTPDFSHWDKNFKEVFEKIKSSKNFKGEKSENFIFHLPSGRTILVLGMGEKNLMETEGLRKILAGTFRSLKNGPYQSFSLDLDHFNVLNDLGLTTKTLVEIFHMVQYSYDKFQSEKPKSPLKEVFFVSKEKNQKSKIQKSAQAGQIVSSGVNKTRELVNEPPNILTSERLAKEIEEDAKANLPGVKIKILNKSDIQKENMNLLLAVNRGSAYEPRVVHLTYRPKGATEKTKHIALVGKGLTFDSGGYSLKTGGSMMGMKIDMAGAATVYGAFRNAVQLGSSYIISCFLGITDNMVSPNAITPDAIVKSRAGLNVEILNTDAEGRLVLADILDYACDVKPHLIIDAATLTGACVRALGTVCGVMGNRKSAEKFMDVAETQGELSWYLPIFEEYREDMKSKVGDLKNIGASGNAGAQKGAAFLEKFVKKGIEWVHLDIAGVASDAAQLPYCPAMGASGLMVRSLTEFLVR